MIWHYTAGNSFFHIYQSGVIRPATAYIVAGEKPIVWFSTEEFWEPTVFKTYKRHDGTVLEDLGMSGLFAEGIPLWRIGVTPETCPYRWSELKELSGMPPEIATRLAKVAKKMGGNSSRWRGTFTPVRAEAWKVIEIFNGLEWERYAQCAVAA